MKRPYKEPREESQEEWHAMDIIHMEVYMEGHMEGDI